jgi:hypothetical protein
MLFLDLLHVVASQAAIAAWLTRLQAELSNYLLTGK